MAVLCVKQAWYVMNILCVEQVWYVMTVLCVGQVWFIMTVRCVGQVWFMTVLCVGQERYVMTILCVRQQGCQSSAFRRNSAFFFGPSSFFKMIFRFFFKSLEENYGHCNRGESSKIREETQFVTEAVCPKTDCSVV